MTGVEDHVSVKDRAEQIVGSRKGAGKVFKPDQSTLSHSVCFNLQLPSQ